MLYHMQVSQREYQVLQLIAAEHSTNEIASKLFVSDHTIHTHRNNLLRKLDVKNTAGLVRRGFELGYLKINQS